MHILVVDPNIAFGTLLSEELIRLEYTVDQVDSSVKALECAQQTTPALAILDMALEEPDALTLAGQLRELDSSMRLMLIPLIGETLEMPASSISIQGVLPKPFFLPELPSRISAVFNTQVADEPDNAFEEADDESSAFTPITETVLETTDGIDTPMPAGETTLEMADLDDFFDDIPVTRFVDQEHGFIYSRFLNNERRVRDLLDNLVFEVGADGAILTLDEKMLTWVGGFTREQAEPIADVVVQGWRSSEQMARILGREQLQFEQSIAGGSYMLYALGVEENAILAVAIRGSSTLGMIRHRAREVVEQISMLCSIL